MIDFDPLTGEERSRSESHLDRALIFQDSRAFPMVLRAAEARIGYHTDTGDDPYAFDEHLLKISRSTERIAINGQGVADFSNLLGQYAAKNYLYGPIRSGDEMEDLRQEAEFLAKELVLAAAAYEVALATDFDAFLRGESAAHPEPDVT
jgi:hypothetical protein